MEYLKHLHPVELFNSIKEGRLMDHFDKRVLSALIALVGLKLAYKYVLTPVHTCYKYFLRPSKDLYNRYGGGWAVVTGASDGIGLGYCKALALLGFNVFMIAKNTVRLNKAVEEVKKVNPFVETKILAFDFNRPYNAKTYKFVIDSFDKLDVSVLINNVGVSYGTLFEYHNISDDDIISNYQVNIIPMIHLTKHLLGKMIKRDHRSAVVSISSISSMMPMTGHAIYTGTKKFINNFMSSLSQTAEYSKVDFLTLKTGSVKTSMNPGNLMLTVNADDYAKKSLSLLGHTKVDYGHWKHHLYMSMLLNPVTRYIVIHNMNSVSDWDTNKLWCMLNEEEL